MQSRALSLPEVVVFAPSRFEDERGSFFESFNQRLFTDATGFEGWFVQDNHSTSKVGVVRGLHYQLPPHAQGKLVRVVRGAIFDVAVDVRRSSVNFGKWVGFELTEVNRQNLWIPPGFAHGFLSLVEGTEVIYKTTEFWNRESERSIAWDDASLAIAWPIRGAPLLSQKDRTAPQLVVAETFQ